MLYVRVAISVESSLPDSLLFGIRPGGVRHAPHAYWMHWCVLAHGWNSDSDLIIFERGVGARECRSSSQLQMARSAHVRGAVLPQVSREGTQLLKYFVVVAFAMLLTLIG